MSDKKAFNNDCFGRKEFADNLLKLINNQVDYESRVIAIKADFGLGKTFFAKEFEKLMCEHLENAQDLPKIYPHYVNIWKENYTNEPLLALLYALENIADKYQRLWNKKAVKKNANRIIAMFSAILESATPFGKFIAKAKNNLKTIKANDKFDNIKSYEKIAQNIIKAFESQKDKKFVIIVDEIDRCMPEYAIRFLETLKHFFDIKGLYFVLMFNENYLQKSLADRFDYIDFALWKDKFIDLEFDLSVFHSQERFIEYLVKKYGFGGKIDNANYKILSVLYSGEFDNPIQFENWTSFINSFLDSLDIDLNYRQLNTLCFRLDLALKVIGNETIMPDCLMCIVLKDIINDNTIGTKREYNGLKPFTYTQDNKRKHIIRLFYDKKDIKEIVSGDEVFLINKKAAEFAILANEKQSNIFEFQDSLEQLYRN